MRRLSLILGICAIATCPPVQAAAQQNRSDRSSADNTIGAADKDNITGHVLAVASGANTSASVKAAPVLSLEGTTDAGIAKAQVGLQYRGFTFTAGAKANIGDTSQPVTLADLDGLRDKTTGEFGLLWSKWLAGYSGDVNVVLDPVCARYASATGRTEGSGDDQFRCRMGWFRKDRSAAGQAAYKELVDKLTPGRIFFAGITGSVAPESFTFVSADTLAAQPEEKHTSRAFSAVAGVAFRTNTVTTFSYTHEVAYSAGVSADVCSPATTGGALQCVPAVVGPPGDPARTNRLSFEVKQFFGTNFAFAPKFNWDVDDSIVGVELPVYLLQAKDGGLTGGVTLGWRSDTKAFTASAFVGPVLKLITRE
jgi:hypothetical protein